MTDKPVNSTPAQAAGGNLPEAAAALSRKHDWCPACHRGWSWRAKDTSETVIGADGKSRPITQREAIARAALRVINDPDGVETIDWQIADAVLALGASAPAPPQAAPSPLIAVADYLEDHAKRLTGLLARNEWTPRRSHVEGNRNAFVAAENSIRHLALSRPTCAPTEKTDGSQS